MVLNLGLKPFLDCCTDRSERYLPGSGIFYRIRIRYTGSNQMVTAVILLKDLKWIVDTALLNRMKEVNQKTLKTMDETIEDARGDCLCLQYRSQSLFWRIYPRSFISYTLRYAQFKRSCDIFYISLIGNLLPKYWY